MAEWVDEFGPSLLHESHKWNWEGCLFFDVFSISIFLRKFSESKTSLVVINVCYINLLNFTVEVPIQCMLKYKMRC